MKSNKPPVSSVEPKKRTTSTHDEYGNAYDQMNSAKGMFHWIFMGVFMLVLTIASCKGYI